MIAFSDYDDYVASLNGFIYRAEYDGADTLDLMSTL